MFYEKMSDEINRILNFDSLDLIVGKVNVNLNDKQASYVWHNVKNREHDYMYEGGIKEYVAYINKNKTPIHDEIIYVEDMQNDIKI